MKTPDPPPAPRPSAEFDAFDQLARRLISVPKAEIDRREAEYQKGREGKPKPGPKPGPKDD